MWKLVLDQAKTKNIQVFATTHSWDCIEGLARLCEREPEWQKHVAIHTVDRNLARNVVFNGDSIVGLAKHHIDPR